MWRELNDWEDFPSIPATVQQNPATHRFDEAINRYAERFLGMAVAGAPFFYVALFLAYLAVDFGIIR